MRSSQFWRIFRGGLILIATISVMMHAEEALAQAPNATSVYVGEVGQHVRKLFGTETYTRTYRLELTADMTAGNITMYEAGEFLAKFQLTGKLQDSSTFVGVVTVENGPPEWIRDRDRMHDNVRIVFSSDRSTADVVYTYMDTNNEATGTLKLVQRAAPSQVATQPRPQGQQTSTTASFDCSKAKTASARLICADSELARLDGQLGAVFQKRRSRIPATEQQKFAADEVAWIRERNVQCNLVGKDNAPINTLVASKSCMVSAIRANRFIWAGE